MGGAGEFAHLLLHAVPQLALQSQSITVVQYYSEGRADCTMSIVVTQMREPQVPFVSV